MSHYYRPMECTSCKDRTAHIVCLHDLNGFCKTYQCIRCDKIRYYKTETKAMAMAILKYQKTLKESLNGKSRFFRRED